MKRSSISSLRDLQPADLTLSLAGLLDHATGVTIRQLTIDQSTSDGLSDFANSGDGRLGKREITQAELMRLSTLAFFDASYGAHVTYSGDRILTYLPPFETILPLVDNPETIDDYYFAAEADVSPLITELDTSLLSTGSVDLDLMPYDVVEITIDTKNVKQGSNGSDTIKGGYGTDILYGNNGADYIYAGEGDDRLYGGSGDDRLSGGSGDDSLYAGAGSDWINGGDGADLVSYNDVSGRILIDLEKDVRNTGFSDFFDHGHASGDRYSNIEIYSGGAGDDNLRGDAQDNVFYGMAGDDRLYGRAGNDTLSGGAGNDTLYGNDGVDRMTGGGDADDSDHFVFFHASDSGTGAGQRDVITDFRSGTDRIDLSRLNGLDYIAVQDFSNQAGELRYQRDAGNTIIQADLNGDGIADFEILLETGTALSETDFLL